MLSSNPKRPGYNKWAVQIKAKSGLPVLFMATYERRTEKIHGEILTFVFDDEAKARQFDADLRNAIRVCKDFEPEQDPRKNSSMNSNPDFILRKRNEFFS